MNLILIKINAIKKIIVSLILIKINAIKKLSCYGCYQVVTSLYSN